MHLLSILCLLSPLIAAQIQAPALPGAQAIDPADRIYTGDQSSNTITVISPFTNSVLGTISLGDQRLTDDLGPQYLKVTNSHGLGFSRDGKYIVSLGITTNTVTVICTLDNSIVSQTYSDRALHEAFFAADNRTVWVACRGTSNVNLIDGISGGVVAKIRTPAPGPSKVLFSPDGSLAYVNHILSPTLDIIDVASRTVIDTITGLADVFSSDMMISADGTILWVAHKMVGKLTVIDLTTRSISTVVTPGLELNHPNFCVVNNTNLAFITVAGLNQTQVYIQNSSSEAPTFLKTIPASGIEPHGIWCSPDNTRLYTVNEHSDTVDVIDTSSLTVIDTVPVGQEGQALVYVAGAVPSGNGTQNLGVQGLSERVENKLLSIQGNTTHQGDSSALVTIRALSGLDMFQVIGRNLELNTTYVASATCATCNGGMVPLVEFSASMKIAGTADCGTAPQVLGFFKFFDVYDIDSLVISKT